MRLEPLFHWSPTERRKEIRAGGLKPWQPATVTSSRDHVQPYVSLSPTPSMAWGLSGDMEWVSEIEQWDLWQVYLPDKAEVHVRPTWGSIIEEVKVYTVIPPDMLWFCGQKGIPFMEEVANAD